MHATRQVHLAGIFLTPLKTYENGPCTLRNHGRDPVPFLYR